MLFVYYPKCSTCRKMKNWLDDRNIQYEARDLMKQIPTAKELESWHKLSALPLSRFVNSSGQLYRDLDLKNKLYNMPTDKQYEILTSSPYLIRRPLLIGNDFVFVGSRIEEWDARFNKQS